MTFDPNDPRLTAYVLGELDPAECTEIEAMLETSAEGRQAVRRDPPDYRLAHRSIPR